MIRDKEYLSHALGNANWWFRQVHHAVLSCCVMPCPVFMMVCFQCALSDCFLFLVGWRPTGCAQHGRQAERAHPDVTSVMIGDFGTIEGSEQRDIKYVMFSIDELPESDILQFGFPARNAPKACVRVTCRFHKQRGHLDEEGQLYM